MASRTFTSSLYLTNGYHIFTYGGANALLNSDDGGGGVTCPNAGGRTIQVSGTFGTGGTVIAEGSNDGTNWYPINDLGGTAISFTAAGLKGIREDCVFVRPRVTAGDGTTSITVVISARRNNNG